MRIDGKARLIGAGLSSLVLIVLGSTAQAQRSLGDQEMASCIANPGLPDADEGFTHQTLVPLDGSLWYFLGAEHELNFTQKGQPQDVAGHCWKGTPDFKGNLRFIAKHFNTGPLGMGGPPKFWSSTAGEHEQLYWVDAIISDWTPEIAVQRALMGYVHYHELVQKDTGCKHPTKVVWLRHAALIEFTFDGGPPRFRENGNAFRPRNIPHVVHPGVDFAFPPTYDIPYEPEVICGS